MFSTENRRHVCRVDSGRALIAMALAMLIALVAACSERETQTITPWLRVEVLRPRADDMIRIGRRAEVFEIRRGNRWRKVGVGNLSRFMVVEDGTAVLVDLNDGKGLQLLLPDESPRAIPASFGRMGAVSIPFPSAIDVLTTLNPRTLEVHRYDLSGKQLAHFTITVPDAYSDCRVTEGLIGYGMDRLPYASATCPMGSLQAKCLMVGPRGFVHAVPPAADWSECGTFGRSGVSLMQPAPFTLFH